MPDESDPRDDRTPAPGEEPFGPRGDGPPAPGGAQDGLAADDDPRNEPAPFGTIVLLTVASAAAVMVLAALMSDPPGLKFLLFGPIAFVVFEVVGNEVWWKRWWGAIPGAVVGLAMYVEGRTALADVIGDTWAYPVAYVTAWALFAVIFALCSRYPRSF
ncbi:hypothetical protein ACFOY2_36430 [Nonomuraea purpurea]|uniref:Uncharacterized protein n=1 Tax=Nonomuraea purpurea TaxID=1849276 RepID=A0ABV8GFP1_9ACTN